MTQSLDIGRCSGSAESCVAVQQAFEADTFYEAVQDLDPGAVDMRELLGQFVTTCAMSRCLGQHPEQAREILRAKLHPES